MSNKGKEVSPLMKLGVQVQKGDHYLCQKKQPSVTKYKSNGQTSSYQSEEIAAVVTKIDKSSTTTVSFFQRRVEETIHHKSPPPVKDKITHFSHRHALHQYEVQKRDKINCNICAAEVVDKAWSCESCKFFIHKSCENIPQKIKHKSHLRDTLTLRSSTDYAGGEFICDACLDSDRGFHYHCSPCKFDIHVACAGLPSAVNYPKHKNPLILCYDFPFRSSDTVKCKVCDMKINKKGWAYYNEDSKFIAHIYCAVDKKKKDSIHKSLPPVKDKITHFSHRHALHQYEVQKRDKINCNICEAEVVDKAWSCESCKFFIHKSCENIPQKIKHKSHLRDTLTLRSSTNYACGEFICNACRDSDKGFHYHCSPCEFDIHVTCAGLPSAVNYPKHKNPLILCYDFPIRSSETVKCKVCDIKINKKGWAYYNEDSKFIAHIYCAVDKKKKDSILAIQKRFQSLQIK